MDIQRGRRGLVPVRSAIVRDEEGDCAELNNYSSRGGGGIPR